jgi:hypothetical protein
MPKCKDCKFFKPKEDKPGFGDCFGVEVEAERDANECPQKAFQPREEGKEEE